MKLSALLYRIIPLLAGFITVHVAGLHRRLSVEPDRPQIPTPLATAELLAAQSVPMNGSLETRAAELGRLPVERQFTAWTDACLQLVAEGRWQEAVQLANLAQPFEHDGKALFPLGDVMETLASTNPLEVTAWLESEIAGKTPGMYVPLYELFQQWARIDPATCLETARRLSSKMLAFPGVVIAVMSRDPSVVTSEDLLRVIPENENPKETISTISYCIGASDPARAMKWAKTLETPAQRSYAAVAIAKSAARENRPETWDLIGNLKTPENRETAAGLWGEKAYASNAGDALQKLASIPDPALISPAAKEMLEKAAESDFGKAFTLAETMNSSGVLADALEQLVVQTRIPPEEWTEGSKDERLLRIKDLTPQQKEALYAAAAKLMDGKAK